MGKRPLQMRASPRPRLRPGHRKDKEATQSRMSYLGQWRTPSRHCRMARGLLRSKTRVLALQQQPRPRQPWRRDSTRARALREADWHRSRQGRPDSGIAATRSAFSRNRFRRCVRAEPHCTTRWDPAAGATWLARQRHIRSEAMQAIGRAGHLHSLKIGSTWRFRGPCRGQACTILASPYHFTCQGHCGWNQDRACEQART